MNLERACTKCLGGFGQGGCLDDVSKEMSDGYTAVVVRQGLKRAETGFSPGSSTGGEGAARQRPQEG
uniref:Uncharacterized protein n=1 Tax=Oryza punctata TaxID=4537 RepID=A0A0E0MPV8_ORYPU